MIQHADEKYLHVIGSCQVMVTMLLKTERPCQFCPASM